MTGDRGDFARLQTEQLSVGHSPQTFVVGTPQFPTINSALARIQGVQARETTIQIMPGTYEETLHLDNFMSSMRLNFDPAAPLEEESRGLFIEGDTRAVSGVTYLSGGFQTAWASRVWNSPTLPTLIVSYDPPLGTVFGTINLVNVPTPGVASNVVNVIITTAPSADQQDDLLLPGSIVQPDFNTLGVVPGDRIVVCDSLNALSMRNITFVSGNQIGFDGAAVLFDTDGAAITFLSNVTVLNTTAATDTCVVSGCSLTMKGIHFEVSSTSFNVRNNFLVAGAATVQTPNCVFSDVGFVTEWNVYITGGAVWFNGDRSNGKQIVDTAVTGYAIPYTYNRSFDTFSLSASIIGGGNKPNNFAVSGCVFAEKGGSIQDGNIWIVDGTAAVSNFTPCLTLASGNHTFNTLQTTGGGLSFEIINANVLIKVLATYFKFAVINEVIMGSTYNSFGLQRFSGFPGSFPTALLIGSGSTFNIFTSVSNITTTDGLTVKNAGIGLQASANAKANLGRLGNGIHTFNNIIGITVLAQNSSVIDFGRTAIVNITNSSVTQHFLVENQSSINFDRLGTLNITNSPNTGGIFNLNNQSQLGFNRQYTINIDGASTGPFSFTYGQAVLNLNNTNLTSQGVWVHTIGEPLAQPVDYQAWDGTSSALALTFNPTLSTSSQSVFTGRVFKLYARSTPRAHTLTLTAGRFIGVNVAATRTVATLAGVNFGEGLTFEVTTLTGDVQVLSSTGVVFT